jgi:hypothetical protein
MNSEEESVDHVARLHRPGEQKTERGDKRILRSLGFFVRRLGSDHGEVRASNDRGARSRRGHAARRGPVRCLSRSTPRGASLEGLAAPCLRSMDPSGARPSSATNPDVGRRAQAVDQSQGRTRQLGYLRPEYRRTEMGIGIREGEAPSEPRAGLAGRLALPGEFRAPAAVGRARLRPSRAPGSPGGSPSRGIAGPFSVARY